MYEPRPAPFASSHFAATPYGLAPAVADFGFLFPFGGGGAGSELASDPAPAPQPVPVAAALAGHHQRYASSQPVSSSSDSDSPSPPAAAVAAVSSAPAGASAAIAVHPRRQHHLHQLHHQHHHQQPPPHQSHTQFPSQPNPSPLDMEPQQQHDVAAQQEAARDYQPVLEGPPVGAKTASSAITHEYAKADQVYVEKTIALPQTYSHYRPIQGDGNCGWRAIGFSYYEKLIEVGDQAQIEGEVARLMSLSQMLGSVGGYTYFEDWADEAMDLLRELAANVANPGVAHMMLLQRWNDSSSSSGIIYYLRLLAATYLKANANTYDPFIPDGQGVQGYCSSSIEIPNREIEHLGIVALANILFKPVNFVLEIAYLDRSPGTQVNRYRFPEEANGQDPANLGPIIYLLYRPDHYDILYQSVPEPTVSVPVQPVSMQVNRVTSFAHDINISSTQDLSDFSNVNFNTMSLIPFAPAGAGIPPSMASPTATSPITESFSTGQPQSPWLQFPDSLSASTPQPQPQQQPQPPPVVAPPAPATPTTPLSPTSPLGTGTAALVAQTQNGMTQSGYHIRFSPVQLEYEKDKSSLPEQTFQVTTNTFKNSVWNRAHYGNPDFHPEEWSPDDDSIDGRIGGRRKMRKDSS